MTEPALATDPIYVIGWSDASKRLRDCSCAECGKRARPSLWVIVPLYQVESRSRCLLTDHPDWTPGTRCAGMADSVYADWRECCEAKGQIRRTVHVESLCRECVVAWVETSGLENVDYRNWRAAERPASAGGE